MIRAALGDPLRRITLEGAGVAPVLYIEQSRLAEDPVGGTTHCPHDMRQPVRAQ